MAEIPAGEYSHIHRSIDQLRSGVLQLSPLNGTDIRASLVHDYKPYISDLRHNGDRLDYTNKANGLDVRSDVGANNNNNAPNDVEINRHNRSEQQQQQTQQDIKSYSSPSTPPTPLSTDGHMNDSKVCIHIHTTIFGYFFFFSILFLQFVFKIYLTSNAVQKFDRIFLVAIQSIKDSCRKKILIFDRTVIFDYTELKMEGAHLVIFCSSIILAQAESSASNRCFRSNIVYNIVFWRHNINKPPNAYIHPKVHAFISQFLYHVMYIWYVLAYQIHKNVWWKKERAKKRERVTAKREEDAAWNQHDIFFLFCWSTEPSILQHHEQDETHFNTWHTSTQTRVPSHSHQHINAFIEPFHSSFHNIE